MNRALCVKCGRRPKQKLKNRLDCFCAECRSAYGKTHYAANKSSYNDRRYQRSLVQRRQVRAYIDARKSGPCVDCGDSHPPWAMEFDHRAGTKKLFNLGDAARLGLSLTTIAEEIAKCDLRCVLCHRYKTHGVSRIHRGVA